MKSSPNSCRSTSRYKKTWGTLKGCWGPHDIRDEIVDFVHRWSGTTEIAIRCLLLWLGLALSTFYSWWTRYGKANEHNAQVPRDHWLEDWERRVIVEFERWYPEEGYRRLAFMMLDEDVAAASPTTVYRVLKQHGRLRPALPANPCKGKKFHQPDGPHRHWHTDISYLNIGGTFCFLISVIDGYSRMVLHCEIREKVTKFDVELVVQRAREKFPGEHPRIITDNGPQYISREFKEFTARRA